MKTWNERKYCGRECVDKGRRMTTNWINNLNKNGLLLGSKLPASEKQKKTIAKLRKGIFTAETYGAIHYWVRVTLGEPTECELCGDKNRHKKHYHWSNKNHLYKRSKEDWQRLCVSCHRIYDKKYN